jgi:type I restriction enzyme S subunit
MTPKHWQSAKAEDALDATSRIGWKGLKKSDFTQEGPILITGMHFLDDGNVDWKSCFHIPQWRYDESPEVMVRPHDILLTKDGTIGKVAYVNKMPGPAALNSHLYLLRPKADRLTPRFVYHVLRSERFRDFAQVHATGSTISGLPWKAFRHFTFPVPPLGEQRKIAGILSSVDAAIEATQAVIDQLQIVKKAMMAELLTRGLPGRHTRFKETEIGEVPEGWEVMRMETLAGPKGMVGGPFGSDLTAKDYVTEPGVPVIRGGNVSMGSFRDDEFVFVSEDKGQALSKNSARRGDIVMTQRGASLGETTLIPFDSAYGWYVISQTMMRMTPDTSRISPRFLLHYICSATAQSWLQNHQIATGQPHLNLGIFRDMPAVVPGRDEQEAIAEVAESIDVTISANDAQLAELRRVKGALMSVLLTGELRVTPAEEPA